MRKGLVSLTAGLLGVLGGGRSAAADADNCYLNSHMCWYDPDCPGQNCFIAPCWSTACDEMSGELCGWCVTS